MEDEGRRRGDDYRQLQQLEWGLLEMVVNTALVLARVLKHDIQPLVTIIGSMPRLEFSCVWLRKIEDKYKLSFVSDKYWQIASLAWWACTDRLWPYLSLDISYWQDGPRRIGWVFAPRCEIWLGILVVGRRWRVVHIVITNQERVVSVINLRRLVSCGHVKSENQWKDAARQVAPVKNKIKRSINFM